MDPESKLSIVFSDGSRVNFSCPPANVAQDPGNILQAALEAGQLSVEVDGDLVVVPLANVKYLRLSPGPARSTGLVLRGARITE